MKKLTTIAAGLILLFSLSAFTPNANVSSKVRSVFEQSFKSVSDVKWTAYEDIVVASFKDKDHSLSAAYSLDGQLICVGKSISMSELPLKINQALESKYSGYTINPEIVEVSTDITSYVIYAENNKYKLKIKADGSGNLLVEDKTKKK